MYKFIQCFWCSCRTH